MFGRFEKTRVAEEIVRHLLRSIFDQTLRPGDRLPSERSLSSRLGVNRASLREAIKYLEHMGLVRTRQGDGTRVLDFMGTAGFELLQHLITYASQDSARLMRDLFEVRRILGREMARLAASRFGPEDIADLRKVQQEAVERADDPTALLVQDTEMFAALGRTTQNRVVVMMANSIRTSVERRPEIFVRTMPEPTSTLEYHQQLIDAVAGGDGATAAEVTDRYLAQMEARLE